MAVALGRNGQAIHDVVPNDDELTGLRHVDEVFLAAACVMAIAQDHCFHAASGRAAYRTMQVVFDMNGAREPDVAEDVIGKKIISLAQGLIDDGDVAEWLRDTA